MEHRNTLALEVTKHIITISMTSIGLLVSGLATIFKVSYTINDFSIPILFFIFAIVFAVLSQIALVSKSQGDRLAFGVVKDEYIIMTAWGTFLIGIFITIINLLNP
ncbi:hypothetical protein KJ870_11025 [bacterium]|nr:hypothetical protein [bacterium]MBU1435462.1 hypothetical protein [bacterium]MBU1502614.1 hypothetical protein [bacterium]